MYVAGEVQGVGFRAATFAEARKFPNVSGFVKNLPDGRVEALFMGTETEVLALCSWCARGPAHSVVRHLTVNEEPLESNYERFEILRD